jgi:coenzyme F420-reducing hydrogenase beta subunit
MMVTEKQNNLCTGCGVCAAICPKKCLDIRLDEDGFYKAFCNEAECVNCGLCDKVCPKFMSSQEKTAVSVLSVVAKDEETLKTTSSGGLCYELAKRALTDGKKVCGCVYNYELHRAEHAVITDMESLEATKGSKYFQSYTPDAFSRLLDGSQWVVFGSPCQIAAVDAMTRMKKVRDQFLLVDFFCHGVPSMDLWKKYIAEQGGERIKKIDFRSKEFGWHAFSLKFTDEDGKVHTDYEKNLFYTFFLGNYCLGEACHACKFKAMKSASDIRVGDFWGDKYRADRKGVSCCVSFTEKGAEAMQTLSDVCLIRDEELTQVLEEQMSQSPKQIPQRRTVLKQLKGNKSLRTIFSTTMFPYRLKCKIKSMLRRAK